MGRWAGTRMIGGEGGFGERTIARNVYARLLLARKLKKFIATKVLERGSVNFISDYEPGVRSYVHRAALSISIFIARYQKSRLISLS